MPFRCLTAPRRQRDVWLGVAHGPDRLIAALAEPGADGRPRVLDAARFVGPDASRALFAWQRERGHRRCRVNLLLERSDYRILQLAAPPGPREEWADALRWQLREQIDFPPEEAALDCLQLPGEAPSGAQARLLAVVAHRQVVVRWMSEFARAGSELAAIDIPEQALRNLALLPDAEAPGGLLHLGMRSTRVVMTWRGDLCAFRQLEIGAADVMSDDVDVAIATCERLALEVQRTADAFSRQFAGIDLARLWVSSVTRADTLVDRLRALVTLKVEPFRIDQWVDLDAIGSAFDVAQGFDYTLPIGAALRQ